MNRIVQKEIIKLKTAPVFVWASLSLPTNDIRAVDGRCSEVLSSMWMPKCRRTIKPYDYSSNKLLVFLCFLFFVANFSAVESVLVSRIMLFRLNWMKSTKGNHKSRSNICCLPRLIFHHRHSSRLGFSWSLRLCQAYNWFIFFLPGESSKRDKRKTFEL